MSKEVRAAIRREYRKATVKRTATMRHSTFRSTVRGRRWSSSYANQNSVYWDNPTSVTYRSSFHHRASILLSKIKQPSTLLSAGDGTGGVGMSRTNSGDGTRTNGQHTTSWTTNSAIITNNTPSPETIGFLPNGMTVTFTRNSNCNSISGENKSDSENNEISMQNVLLTNNHCCLDFEASQNEINGESLGRNAFPPGVL
ncbi:unnamed protein product [Allacma fusca]|uniref:Uncharacterized protein n=1 Tax=Allacma fusca TaxID=39272 RepID=A0A8J2KNC4_9HEXA|nr:unnamed protein product [Allacma fusca]